MSKRLLLILALALFCATLFSQNITVNAPSTVGVGEKFEVIVSVSASESFSEPQWNIGKDFQLVWGPSNIQNGTSISIVNGKKTTSINKSYKYILLSKTEGSFTLPPVVVELGGRNVSSRSITINVSQNASSQGQQPSASSRESSDPNPSGAIENFLKLSLSKKDIVVGEPITATLKLYAHAGNIAGFEDAKFPTFNGFWSQKTYDPDNVVFREEKFNNKTYITAVLGEWVLIPQQTGNITIDPAEITCVARISVTPHTGMGQLFDSMFEDIQQVKRRAVSEKYTMNVKQLPAGAPESFSGAVGKFSISVSSPSDSLKTHEASALKVTISGQGNISMLEAPTLKFPSDFEMYDVKQTDAIDQSGINGSRTFEYPFIPRSYGDFEIPAIEYSYYDNEAGKYITVSTKPLVLKVAKSKSSDVRGDGRLLGNISAKKVEDLGSDIRYISTSFPSLHKADSFFALSPLYFVLALLLLFAFAAGLIVMKKKVTERADIALSRNKGAVKMARKRLSLAGDFLAKNLSSSFYEELHRALLGYAGDKLTIDPASLSKENIGDKLLAKGVGASICDRFTSLLEACEFARYSPEGGTQAMNTHYSEALDIITSIEASMKHTKKKPTTVAILLLLLLLPAANINAQGPEDIWNQATAQYSEGKWQDAFDSYSKIEQMGLESAELYCNMGDAAFKNDKLAIAILYYERALKLNPSYTDARHNLAFANLQVQDRIDEVPQFFLKVWIKNLSHLFSADVWAILSIMFLALFLAMWLLFRLSSDTKGKKAGFYLGIVALVLLLISFGFSTKLKKEYMSKDKAIVVSPVSKVMSSPGGEGGQDLFVLHEGTKVEVIDKVGDWNNIKLSDGRQGWLKMSEISII